MSKHNIHTAFVIIYSKLWHMRHAKCRGTESFQQQLACFAIWAAIAAPSESQRVPRQNEENRTGHWIHRRNTMDVENICICKTSTLLTLLLDLAQNLGRLKGTFDCNLSTTDPWRDWKIAALDDSTGLLVLCHITAPVFPKTAHAWKHELVSSGSNAQVRTPIIIILATRGFTNQAEVKGERIRILA